MITSQSRRGGLGRASVVVLAALFVAGVAYGQERESEDTAAAQAFVELSERQQTRQVGLRPRDDLVRQAVARVDRRQNLPRLAGLYDLHVDPIGRLWVGSDTGLSVYNGNRFRTTFASDAGENMIRLAGDDTTLYALPAADEPVAVDLATLEIERLTTPFDTAGRERANDLHLGEGGRLWIVGGFGLARLDRQSRSFELVLDKDALRELVGTALPNRIIDLGDRLVIACSFRHVTAGDTDASGQTATLLLTHEIDTGHTALAGVVPTIVRSLLAETGDAGETLWVGTYAGLFSLDLDADTPTVTSYPAVKGDASMPLPSVERIHKTDDGRLWLGTVQGLCEVDPLEGWVLHHGHDPDDELTLSADDVRALAQDREGQLWMGHFDGQFSRMSIGGRFATTYRVREDGRGLLSPMVRDAVVGADGTLWVAMDEGISRLRPGETSFEHVRVDEMDDAEVDLSGWRETLSKGSVYTIAEDADGRVWFGQLYAGFGTIDPETMRVRYEQLVPDDDRRLDFGLSMLSEADGTRWHGTASGVVEVRPDGSVYRHRHQGLPSPPTVIHAVHRHSDGALWIGTEGGAARRGTDGEWRNFTHDPEDERSLPDDQVYGFHTMPDGELWIATYAGVGVVRPDEAGVADPVASGFEVLDQRVGLPSNSIGGITHDEMGAAWIGTEAGLVRYDRVADEMRTFDDADDVPVMYAAISQRLDDGRLLFGGHKGVTIIDPAAAADAPNVEDRPRVVLSRVDVAGEVASVATPGFERPSDRDADADPNTISLPRDRRFFTVSFDGVDLAAGWDLVYRYRLRGYEQDWHDADADARRATYMNLAPGSYTFEVQAADVTGEWGPAATLAVDVPPRMWETAWFKGLAGVLALAGVYGLYRWRRSIQNRRFKAVLDERTRIATELHDGLLQSLYGVQLKAQAARRRMDRDVESAKALFDDAIVQTTETLAEARQRILASPLAGDRGRRGDTIGQVVRKTATAVGELYGVTDKPEAVTKLVLEVDETPMSRSAPAKNAAARIVAEAVANAARHAEATVVKVAVRRDPGGGCEVLIEDDGKGFDTKAAGTGRSAGTRLIHTRAAEVGADVAFEPGEDRGTRIRLRFPPTGLARITRRLAAQPREPRERVAESPTAA